MNNNAKDQAFPALATTREQYIGLTKRELFAGLAMAGLLADPRLSKPTCAQFAQAAIAHADALLTELDKPQQTEADNA